MKDSISSNMFIPPGNIETGLTQFTSKPGFQVIKILLPSTQEDC